VRGFEYFDFMGQQIGFSGVSRLARESTVRQATTRE
jgi:hypothetical protein